MIPSPRLTRASTCRRFASAGDRQYQALRKMFRDQSVDSGGAGVNRKC